MRDNGKLRLAITYAIVDETSLAARPLAERLLPDGPSRQGGVTWRRGRALHQIELISTWPVADLGLVAPHLQESVRRIDAELGRAGARLLPGGLHPFMDPVAEAKCEGACFDRAELDGQASRLELAGLPDLEAVRAALHLLLPLLPALTAASPCADGRPTGSASTRGARFGLERIAVEGGALSVTVGDTQEHPGRDAAIASALAEVVLRLSLRPRPVPPAALRRTLHAAACRDGERALVPAAYVRGLGLGDAATDARRLWRRLFNQAEVMTPALDALLRDGTLATRLGRGLGGRPAHSALVARYRRLAECLAVGAHLP